MILERLHRDNSEEKFEKCRRLSRPIYTYSPSPSFSALTPDRLSASIFSRGLEIEPLHGETGAQIVSLIGRMSEFLIKLHYFQIGTDIPAPIEMFSNALTCAASRTFSPLISRQQVSPSRCPESRLESDHR